MRLPSICRRSSFWLLCFLAWAVLLWILSSGPLPGPKGPSIYGLDKVFHFGYFFGGAGLLSAALYLRGPTDPNWGMIIVVVTVVVACVGILDEWHQSWHPERSGNDPGDWLADAWGALTGSLVFRHLHGLLK